MDSRLELAASDGTAMAADEVNRRRRLVEDAVEEVHAPGIVNEWTLDISHRPEGVDGFPLTERRGAGSPLHIERLVAEHMATVKEAVVRTRHFAGGREMDLANGSRVLFRWLLHVSDSRCLDCGVDITSIDEYYMVNDDVWDAANPVFHGNLCIGCLELRLRRELVSDDFAVLGINTDSSTRSPRLTDRLGRSL